MRHELRLASQIQQRFLPQTLPELPNFKLYGTMWPALEVGGDYYDIIQTEGKKLYICIGDVSGKGLGAGLIMVMARTTLHSLLVATPTLSCDKLLFQINNMIYHNTKRGIFMSMLLMQIDLASSKISYSGAGHEHILIYRDKERTCERIATGGVILGIKKNNAYQMQELSFQPRDKLLIYTDGATETMNRNNQEFGLDALVGLVEKFHAQPCQELCQSVYSELQAYMAGVPQQHDDITLLAMERMGK